MGPDQGFALTIAHKLAPRLRVTDPGGRQSLASLNVAVGNIAPTVTIDTLSGLTVEDALDRLIEIRDPAGHKVELWQPPAVLPADVAESIGLVHEETRPQTNPTDALSATRLRFKKVDLNSMFGEPKVSRSSSTSPRSQGAV